jgi:TonB family protein
LLLWRRLEMSITEPNEQFGSEDELRALLNRWQSPEPSGSLDKRVSASYLREITQSHALGNSSRLPLTTDEVVTMKLCSTCREEFADKFSFCPVDGTPLNPVIARQEEPSITAVPGNDRTAFISSEAALGTDVATSSAPIGEPEFHLTMMDDSGLLSRLAGVLLDVAREYQLTWPEFKRDPIGFVKRSALGYGQMVGRVLGNRNVMIALGGALVALVVLVAAILLMDRASSPLTSRLALAAFGVTAFTILIGIFATWLGKERGAAVIGAPQSDSQNAVAGMAAAFGVFFLLVGGVALYNFLHNRLHPGPARPGDEPEIAQIINIAEQQPTPEKGTAGMAKGTGGGSKQKQEKAGGGGGGGREQLRPASAGKPPIADLHIPPVVAPDPNPPPIKNPVLPTLPQIDADKALFPPDPRNLPIGMQKGPTDPSSGPGRGNGMGTGDGAGMGPGTGGGYGPGNGGNTGGGDRHEGGGGPGGPGGGTDYNKIFNGKDVTQKARVLSKPEPQYTEDARKNQITGTVTLRVVFTSSGQVTEIHAVKQLPFGLTEKAMAAARMIKFVPAMKDGHPVSQYMQLEYNFNLY